MIALLQNTIDENIAQILTITTLLRNENIPWEKLKIENESDFILGAVFAQILCQYSCFLTTVIEELLLWMRYQRTIS